MTSGTIFASRKLSSTDLLAAIVIFVNGAKGVAALQLSRELDCQYQRAFVLKTTAASRTALRRRRWAVRLWGGDGGRCGYGFGVSRKWAGYWQRAD